MGETAKEICPIHNMPRYACPCDGSEQKEVESVDPGQVEEIHTKTDMLSFFECMRSVYATEEMMKPEQERTPYQDAEAWMKWSLNDFKERTLKKDPDALNLFYGVSDSNSNEMIATAGMVIEKDADGRKKAYLRMLTVREDARGEIGENKRRLNQELTKARVDRARKEDADYLEMHIITNRAISLMVKLREGYTIEDIFGPEDGTVFEVRKEMNPSDTSTLSDEEQKIKLNKTQEISTLLKDGWVGVSIENLEPDESGTDATKWELVLKKRNLDLTS